MYVYIYDYLLEMLRKPSTGSNFMNMVHQMNVANTNEKSNLN